METIIHFFSINTTLFTFMDYQMSYIEFFGTVFNLLCVWLAVKRNVWTWPAGLVSIVLYFFLFFQIQLYSDLFEQMYFFIMSFYGWYIWLKNGYQKDTELHVEKNTVKENIVYVGLIIIATIILGYFMRNIHIYFPNIFSEPASYPYLDAFTTILSFAATILLAQKKFENWHLWIVVDIIGIWLYYVKGVKFIAFEYLIFLIMASRGFWEWRTILKKEKSFKTNPSYVN